MGSVLILIKINEVRKMSAKNDEFKTEKFSHSSERVVTLETIKVPTFLGMSAGVESERIESSWHVEFGDVTIKGTDGTPFGKWVNEKITVVQAFDESSRIWKYYANHTFTMSSLGYSAIDDDHRIQAIPVYIEFKDKNGGVLEWWSYKIYIFCYYNNQPGYQRKFIEPNTFNLTKNISRSYGGNSWEKCR
jgi:hypothetical protein